MAEDTLATVAVDFDGVLHAYRHGWHDGTIYDVPVPGAVEAVTALLERYAVFVHTTREPEQVMPWLERYDLPVTIDERCCGWSRGPFAGCPRCGGTGMLEFWNHRGDLLVTNRKLPAVVYIDDRGLRFDSWPRTLRELTRRDPGAGRLAELAVQLAGRGC